MKSSLRIVGLLVVSAAVVVSALAVGCQDKSGSSSGSSSGAEPIVWYGMMPHPYISQVQQGVEASAKANNVKILIKVGEEWSQDNESANVKTLSTMGHKAFSIFPGDPAASNGLFKLLRSNGQFVVAYGAEPDLPTPASFTVATDIPGAARVAAEELIKLMGDKGNILNVLETVTDVNTVKRDEAIKEVVAKHPNVKIIQTISDMTQVTTAKEKIAQTIVARGDEIDGIITTGWNPTVAAAAILSERHKDPNKKRIRFIGIDDDETVIKAIKDGSIDATIAQNPFGHGYISTTILKMMLEGWKPVKDYQFINAGIAVVTKANVDTYKQEVKKITDGIVADLKSKYLTAPAAPTVTVRMATTQPAN
jgi:ribose transport system substrate-binding protein